MQKKIIFFAPYFQIVDELKVFIENCISDKNAHTTTIEEKNYTKRVVKIRFQTRRADTVFLYGIQVCAT